MPLHPPAVYALAMTTYKHSTTAFALLFNNGMKSALRVEAPGLALEFTDGVYIGRDPEGLLQYNKISDLTKTGGTHHYHVSKVLQEGATYCQIEFRFGSLSATPYAKFIAPDPTDAAYGSGMYDYSSSGTWGRLLLGSSFATVKKDTSSQQMTITAEPVNIVGKWTAPSDVLADTGFSIDGTLYFKNTTEISQGIHANYNNDRVVFYQNDMTGDTFAAFFIPAETDTTTLQIAPVDTVTFDAVSWTASAPPADTPNTSADDSDILDKPHWPHGGMQVPTGTL